MKIACCTMEMVALIFLLFVSINGGYSYLNNNVATEANLVSKSTTELVSAWGAPDEIVESADIGLNSLQLADVEVWSYYHPVRSVVVRNDIVVSIREG